MYDTAVDKDARVCSTVITVHKCKTRRLWRRQWLILAQLLWIDQPFACVWANDKHVIADIDIGQLVIDFTRKMQTIIIVIVILFARIF